MKPHFQRSKGQWLCHQWIATNSSYVPNAYVWGTGATIQAAWAAYQRKMEKL
jgi:hypothetical protein